MMGIYCYISSLDAGSTMLIIMEIFRGGIIMACTADDSFIGIFFY
jgi:hypothetical protein